MCGIGGAFGRNAEKLIKQINEKQIHRGPDASNTKSFHNLFLSHNLLSIVDFVPQPISDDKHILVANCEIYNWKELATKYKLNVKNDSELIFELLKKNKKPSLLKKIIKEINGVYAIGFFWYDKTLNGYLIRDTFGIRPLWYTYNKETFVFASERKSFPLELQKDAVDLNPRNIISIDLEKMKTKNIYTGFYDKIKTKDIDYEKAKLETKNILDNAIKSRIDTDKKIGILVSGGIDSSYLAVIANKYKEITCYNTFVSDKADDKKYAELLEKKCKLNFKYINPSAQEIEKAIPEICKIIESSDPVKVSVALPFYFVAKNAKKDNVKVVLLGNGADDIFCGYSRFDKNYSLTKDTISRLRKLYDTDHYRDDCIFMNFSIETRHPYLDKKLVDYILSLPDDYKINDEFKKKILRDIAKEYLPKEIYERPKKAAQYGSGFDATLMKIVKKNGFKNKGLYLKQFCSENDSALASLFSGGKDSMLSLHIMHSMNYAINCLVTIASENKDSYMYHTPTISLVEKQADALNIPLIKVYTKGEKEKELSALTKALKIAQNKYHINGVISGAIYSTYQRDRIEKICDKLGLKVYSPLWHKEQYLEVLEVINVGIKPIITKIAAKGLNKSYLGKIIDKPLLEELNSLNKKFGFNIAGEGGEYETFVIDSPLFKEEINFDKLKIKTRIKETDEYTAELIIE